MLHQKTKVTGGGGGGFMTHGTSTGFEKELEEHRKHLTEEMNRRYMLEIRQILNEIGYEAKESVGKEIATRLGESRLISLNEEQIRNEIDTAVQAVKLQLSEHLQGWTVLKSDIAAKSVELEKARDEYEAHYVEKSRMLKKESNFKSLGTKLSIGQE